MGLAWKQERDASEAAAGCVRQAVGADVATRHDDVAPASLDWDGSVSWLLRLVILPVRAELDRLYGDLCRKPSFGIRRRDPSSRM